MCGNMGWSNAAESSVIGAAASAAGPDWFAGVNKTGHARLAGSHQAVIDSRGAPCWHAFVRTRLAVVCSSCATPLRLSAAHSQIASAVFPPSAMALSSRQRLPYDTNLLAPAPGRPRLPITDQVVQDILFAQPRGQLPAAELAELFGAKSGAEREHLLKVVARVGELCYRQNGVPFVRLKKPLGAGRPKQAERSGAPAGMAPLPIEAIEVRRVLLVQRGHQMEAERLRALFAPRGEAQRHALTVAISTVAEIVRPTEAAAPHPNPDPDPDPNPDPDPDPNQP